jgi:hypothetical protein
MGEDFTGFVELAEKDKCEDEIVPTVKGQWMGIPENLNAGRNCAAIKRFSFGH